MAIKREDFPLPDTSDPVTAPFFAGAERGELVIPRCTTCNRFVWYPAEKCPDDGGALVWKPVSGKGTLFSWAVVERAFLPAFADKVPFVTALVALDDDPSVRIPTYVVDVPGDALEPEMPLHVTFRPLEFTTVPGKSVTVPMFAPAQ